MVRTRAQRRMAERGAIMVDLVVAMAIIGLAIVPLVMSFGSDARLMRKCYQRAVADEVVDGEFEVLMAGGWKRCAQGTQPYVTQAKAVASLPPGGLFLTIEADRLRLEWRPQGPDAGGRVVREGRIR